MELDRSLRIVRFNRTFRDTFDLGPDVGPDTPLRDAIPDMVLEAIIRLGLESEEMLRETEFSWPSAGSDQRHFLLSVSPGALSAETVLVSFHEGD